MSLHSPIAPANGSVSKIPVILEIGRTPNQTTNKNMTNAMLEENIRKFITGGMWGRIQTGYLELLPMKHAKFIGNIEYIRCEVLGEEDETISSVDPQQADLTIRIYVLNNDEEEVEELTADADGEEEPVAAGTTSILPHRQFDQLWENLFYDHEMKSSVMDWAIAALKLARAGISTDIIASNRMILLHGPPGTGKTTLCKAIAQKLCIRLSNIYTQGKIIEINSHSLFSKWFSESGKLVQKLFSGIMEELREYPNQLYCVLIDEVESIASSRNHGGNDPQDAVRAGNAVLTQLDRIRRFPNVIVMCTSNLTDMIDAAFCDRVDMKIYIGPPNIEARYEILRSQIEALLVPPVHQELVIANDQHVTLPLPTYKQLMAGHCTPANFHVTNLMKNIAAGSENCGGRILRRSPLRCYQRFITSLRGRDGTLTLSKFLADLPVAIKEQREETERLQQATSSKPVQTTADSSAQPALPNTAMNGNAPMDV